MEINIETKFSERQEFYFMIHRKAHIPTPFSVCLDLKQHENRFYFFNYAMCGRETEVFMFNVTFHLYVVSV